jgi:hypothetical protein
MIPQWRFIFLELIRIGRLGDGWVYNDSPLNYFCPDCGRRLTVGIHIINEAKATYYSHCWGCGFDLKTTRELENGFDYEAFMETI